MEHGYPVQQPRQFDRLVRAFLVSFGVHVLLFLVMTQWVRTPLQVNDSGPIDVEILAMGESMADSLKEEADLQEPQATPKSTPVKPKGQIVELPQPIETEKPSEAKFLAEHNRRVDEETATPLSAVNPRIVTPEYHREQKIELNSKSDGEGKSRDVEQPFEIRNRLVLNPSMNPDFGQSLALNTTIGNKSVPRSERSAPRSEIANIQGAPQNDYLAGIKIDNSTNLNSYEYLFQGFFNRVKRQVNPYWIRYLQNSNPGEKLDRKQYTTVVNVILTSEGEVRSMEITRGSGISVFDESVLQAFRDSAPFVNPPAAMVGPDSGIHLDALAFTVTVNAAQIIQMYIDPRSGIRYPGIESQPHY